MKKGFTLVELLAVIIILGIIAIIAVPTVSKILDDSRNEIHDEQIVQINNAAKRWAVENIYDDGDYKVTVNNLIKGGYLENKDVIDPTTGEKIEGCVKIEFDSNNNQYKYTYTENNC